MLFFFVFMYYDTSMSSDQLVDKQNSLLWRLQKKKQRKTGMQSKFCKRRATGYKQRELLDLFLSSNMGGMMWADPDGLTVDGGSQL